MIHITNRRSRNRICEVKPRLLAKAENYTVTSNQLGDTDYCDTCFEHRVAADLRKIEEKYMQYFGIRFQGE